MTPLATRDAGRNIGGANPMNANSAGMNISPTGTVLSKDQIREKRLKEGNCPDCQDTPVRLYTIKKSRYNPLWSSKQPCTQENQSLDGQCLMCNPALDPDRRTKRTATTSTSNETNVVMGLESLIEDLSSQGNGNANCTTGILVDAMKEYLHSVAVQIFCLGTIWGLCKDSDQYKSSVISTTAPVDIVLSMSVYLDDADIQERACGALWSLSVDPNNRAIVIRAGAPASIVKSIVRHQRDEHVIRMAVGCLRALSSESEMRESMGAVEGIKRVCDAMKAHRTIACIQLDGCAFLSNSAVDSVKGRMAIASNCEFEAIVTAMESHRNDASVMAGAWFALKNYTYEDLNVQRLCAVDRMLDSPENEAQHCDDSNYGRVALAVLERIRQCKQINSILKDDVASAISASVEEL